MCECEYVLCACVMCACVMCACETVRECVFVCDFFFFKVGLGWLEPDLDLNFDWASIFWLKSDPKPEYLGQNPKN